MINSVKTRTPILAFILFVFAVGYTFAANKVVVIPMAADAPPASQWANVSSSGNILDQSGGITIDTQYVDSQAFYYLDFGNGVSESGISATMSYGSKGFINTRRCGTDGGCASSSNYNTVFVRTFDIDGASAKRGFYVVVHP